MYFNNPSFFWFFLLLIIPILVHLFNFRKYHTTYFSNVALLKSIVNKNRKSSQIRKWLLLLTRMLIFSSIILAFCDPTLQKIQTKKQQLNLVIYLDNSFSMQAKSQDGELLKRAVQDLIVYMPKDTTFSLFTNSESYQKVTINTVRDELLSMPYSSKQLTYSEVIEKGKSIFRYDKKKSHNTLVLISDFKDFVDNGSLDHALEDIQIKNIVVSPINQDNVSIENVSYVRGEENLLQIDLFSTQDKTSIPVTLHNNDTLISKLIIETNKHRATANFTIADNLFPYGKIEIDDEGLTYDNVFYFSINKNKPINVLSLSDNDDVFLEALFSTPKFIYKSQKIRTLDYSLLYNQNLIILNELNTLPKNLITELGNLIKRKKVYILLIPSLNMPLNTFDFIFDKNTEISVVKENPIKITTVNFEHPLYKNTFKKKAFDFDYLDVKSHFKITHHQMESIIQYEDETPFLLKKHNIYLFTAPLNQENTNFQISNLIVPTIHNMGKYSLGYQDLFFYNDEVFEIDLIVKDEKKEGIKIENQDFSFTPIQKQHLNTIRILTTFFPDISGNFDIKKGKQILRTISSNFSRNESKPRKSDFQELKSDISIEQYIKQTYYKAGDFELWKIFIILALVFISVELVLLKL